MKLDIFLLFLLSLCTNNFAQTYDLVVIKDSDLLACKIDATKDSDIVLETMINYSRIYTKIPTTRVADYQLEVIDFNAYRYKSCTSIIRARKIEREINEIRDLQKNAVYLGLFSIYYQRLFPMEKIAITVSGGVNFATVIASYYIETPIFIVFESTVLFGGPKHFFEPGVQILTQFYDEGYVFPFLRLGYRYQAPKGFLFRIGALGGFVDESFFPLPSLSLGCSF